MLVLAVSWNVVIGGQKGRLEMSAGVLSLRSAVPWAAKVANQPYAIPLAFLCSMVAARASAAGTAQAACRACNTITTYAHSPGTPLAEIASAACGYWG
jgi:hypothetical protein